MKDLLEKITGFVFESENSFEPNKSPCYYYEKDSGYVVYFFFKGDVVDFGIYDNQKKLISLITNIDQSIEDKWKEQFIKRSIADTSVRKLKIYKVKA